MALLATGVGHAFSAHATIMFRRLIKRRGLELGDSEIAMHAEGRNRWHCLEYDTSAHNIWDIQLAWRVGPLETGANTPTQPLGLETGTDTIERKDIASWHEAIVVAILF
jgi:hypothetical protein